MLNSGCYSNHRESYRAFILLSLRKKINSSITIQNFSMKTIIKNAYTCTF